MIDINEAAKLLGVPELTLRRWIRQGKIPVTEQKKGRYLFDRPALLSWARSKNLLSIKKEQEKTREAETPSLVKAVKRGGILFGISEKDFARIFSEVLDRVELPEGIEKKELLSRLVERERLSSTGIGDGVAVPHPRQPLPGFEGKEMIVTCFLKSPVDFNAIDGNPVSVMFFLFAGSTAAHLKYLSRLSFCLRNKDFINFLKMCRDAEEFIARLERIENKIS